MHPQIKAIISTIRQVNGTVRLDMSADEWTPMGKLLYYTYYQTDLVDIFKEGINGFPHNGGQHTLTINGKRGDVVAWLEELNETLGKFRGRMQKDTLDVWMEIPFIAQEVLKCKP